MMLFEELINRARPECVKTGWKADSFENLENGAQLNLVSANGIDKKKVKGDIIIGADGMHSKIRSQIIPNEGEPIWNGAVLWRGISKGKPFLSSSSMVMIGHATQRVVAYPISKVNENCSLSEINCR